MPYIDPINAQIWESAFGYPSGSLQSIKTWWNFQSPIINGTAGENPLPTIIFSPGGGLNCWGYSVLLSDIASHGYPVIAIDHPGEVPYLQLPYGMGGVFGYNIYYSFNSSQATAIFQYRVADMLAIIRELIPSLVKAYSAPFNLSTYIALGHSVGGAATAEAMDREQSIVAGINYDGAFFTFPDVKRPFLMMESENHTMLDNTTWTEFPGNQTGWWEVFLVKNAGHLDYSDIGLWPDLLGLNHSTTPQIGSISGLRMEKIVRIFTKALFESVLGKRKTMLQPNGMWPEVHVNGQSGDNG